MTKKELELRLLKLESEFDLEKARNNEMFERMVEVRFTYMNSLGKLTRKIRYLLKRIEKLERH